MNGYIFRKEPRVPKCTIIGGVLFAFALVAILVGGSFVTP